MESEFLDENGKWKCIECGACCMNVKDVYPELAGPNGACIHLDKDNRCKIYEKRPPLCRIPAWYPDNLRAKDCDLIKNILPKKVKDI